MSKHENSIDIDGLCCTECAYRGAQTERERIIASLGNCPCNCPTTICDCGCGDEPEFTRNELIALIKGECQKDNETVVLLTEGENNG